MDFACLAYMYISMTRKALHYGHMKSHDANVVIEVIHARNYT